MNKKNKSAFGIFIIILMITLGVILAYYLQQKEIETINYDVSNEVVYNVLNENKNESKNIINNINENVIENDIDETSSNIVIESSQDNINKAIEIVKKDWGEDSTVYFDDAGIDNEGRYIISVHNKETTETLAWYTVDPKTEQFFKQ